ncbi:MAG: bifunctional folylpolyglutamate synthase/dihydrofolate synthase [Bacteroidales bacterium]|nr:bifunctional folylpolyglutamate synthase/dihydrofolate synthase [Bacteroidales bacterium]
MTYEEILEWMYRQIPMFQRNGSATYKIDMETTEQLDARFGYPHQSFNTVHVGGTNGKGSVSHILASVLQTAGYRTGLYTSPHLKDFRERIRVNGRMIEKDFVVDFIRENGDCFEALKSSFFEMAVAMAFQYFKEQRVDVAVVEVGLGGRLDSTNIVYPDLSVITNISLDHTRFLGDTLEAIAGEKAGIIKPSRPVVIGEYQSATAPVFKDRAQECNAPVCFADKEYRVEPLTKEKPGEAIYRVSRAGEVLFEKLRTDLTGSYQSKNLATALKTIDILNSLDYGLSRKSITDGLAHVKRNTALLGRWHVLQQSPLIICDTAHNEAGLEWNLRELKSMDIQNLHFVLGFVNDKDLDTILPLFPKTASYYFTKADIPRALNEQKLEAKAGEYGLMGNAFPRSAQALEEARQQAGPNDLIYVGGSTFLVSEVI